MLRSTWDCAFADGREAELMGEGPERLLEASGRLALDGVPVASCFVEAPLSGESRYDSLVCHNPRHYSPGCRIADASLAQVQSAVDWVSGLTFKPFLHFELDAAGEGTLSVIHCKIEGNLEIAEEFFRAVGEEKRTEAFVRTVNNLPEGWMCQYTGVFPGRTTNNTRMEVKPVGHKPRRLLCDPAYLKNCFDKIGFKAYDENMLKDISRLAEIQNQISIQFDMLPDGTFLPVLSVLSLYEKGRPDNESLFGEDGMIRRTCEIYEEMGISDGRWRKIEPCLFSNRRYFFGSSGFEIWKQNCYPCCTKAKWIGARKQPAKFYLLLDAMLLK